MKLFKFAFIAGLMSFFISASSFADSYIVYVTNKTQDIFTVLIGLKTIGTLDLNDRLKKFEFDQEDSILFVSNSIPRLTVRYDQTNKSPKCSDLFQGYGCKFTKAPGKETYFLAIEK